MEKNKILIVVGITLLILFILLACLIPQKSDEKKVYEERVVSLPVTS